MHLKQEKSAAFFNVGSVVVKKEKKKKNKLGFKELCGKVGLGVKSIKEKTIGNKMSKIAGPRVKLRLMK